MDNQLNLCFIISSIGGPKMLSPVFSRNMRDDVVYIVFQHMPGEEFMETMIHVLKEEIPRTILHVNSEAELVPGNIYFLFYQHYYHIKGNMISTVPQSAGQEGGYKPMDELFRCTAHSNHFSNVIVLSGVFVDRDGIKGVRELKKEGARVLAVSRKHAPVFNMSKDLEKLNLIDEFYPPMSLLANLDFTRGQRSDVTRTHWLVVDDEKNVRDVIGDILHFEKIPCDFATDGLDALRKVQKTTYSGMVLDIKMPELDGLQTLKALQTIDPDLPILIITGFDDEQTHKAAKNPNVVGILLKPFTTEDIKEYFHKMERKSSC